MDIDSSDTGYSSDMSDQGGGNATSEYAAMAFSVCSCTVCVLSIIMIFVINSGRHCKNRGGKK